MTQRWHAAPQASCIVELPAGVLIDLHAAPGSQNGADHSAPTAQGVIGWDSDPSFALQATAFMAALAARYAAAPALLGFGLLNEPAVRGNALPSTLNQTPILSHP